jgi:hypothetical protein
MNVIGIVFVGDLRYCPYLDKYLEVLEEQNTPYEILFWNRENRNAVFPKNYYSFNLESKMARSPIFKLYDFMKFGKWLKHIILDKKYDKLIILSTLSGIFVASTLLKRYKNNYIFDIRDYSYEKYKLFYLLEESIIRNSRFTSISSNGFKNFLPKNYDYVVTNNFSYKDLKSRKGFKKKEKGSVINIVWIGVVRYFEHQSEILKRLRNDKRFNITYHGSGPDLDKLKRFCQNNNIHNVTFTGSYDNSIKEKLLASADILNNSYGIKNENKVKYAIANKYYDGLIYGIPQLVELNTYKYDKVRDIGIGIGLDVYDETFADKLYQYYFGIDEVEFNKICDNEINVILKEEKKYIDSLISFISN